MLTLLMFNDRIQEHCKKTGLQLSWLERTPDKGEVDGSSPFRPTIKLQYAKLAQSVEQSAVNRSVAGSSPAVGAIFLARWRSGLTHIPFTDAFTGSNPVKVTIYSAGLAQLVEQLTCNQQVVGSSPIASTILFGPMAELADAPDLESGERSWEFESPQPHQM